MVNKLKFTRASHTRAPAYQLLGELYAAFADKPFTKEQAEEKIRKTRKLILTNISNWVNRGLITVSPKTHRISEYGVTFQLNTKAITILEAATVPASERKVATKQPAQVVNGSKSPEAILRQIKKQLEDQIDLIDEALESLHRDQKDAAKYRVIADLLKKDALS